MASRATRLNPGPLGGPTHRGRQFLEVRVAMSTQGTPVRSLRLPSCRGPVVLVVALVLSGCASSGLRKVPVDIAPPPMRQRFLEMWARAYFPGRTGQLLVVPREGEFITRPDPN